MNGNGITRVGNIPLTASYMLFGAVPVLENDGLSTAEKALEASAWNYEMYFRSVSALGMVNRTADREGFRCRCFGISF